MNAILAADTEANTNAVFGTAGDVALWLLSVSRVFIANDESMVQAMNGRT